MGKPTYNREIIEGDSLKSGINRGMNKVYKVARSAYGVSAGNVMIENRASAPTISHDGVTNISVLETSDPIQDMTISIIKQASKRTNETAGDGTTLSAILSYHLYKYAKSELMGNQGKSPAEASKIIQSYVPKILKEIDIKTKRDIDSDTLRGVCEVSAGDRGLGQLVFDVMSKVGESGGVNIIYTGTANTSVDFLDGVYIEAGAADECFFNDHTSKESVFKSEGDSQVPVIVIGNTLQREEEIVLIVERLHQARAKKAIIFGNIINDALLYLSKIPKPILDIMVVTPKASMFNNTLEDIAIYSDCDVYRGETSDWKPEMCGYIKHATVTRTQTNITGGKGENSKRLKEAVANLRRQAQKAAPAQKLEIERRIARLTASIANIYVGGSSETERVETRLRIQDAVCAAKTALVGGVVSGGGVCLRDIGSKLGFYYLIQPYYDLLLNSGADSKLLKKKCAAGIGYDLKTLQPRVMLRSNIIDPAIVVREAVINSHSVVSQLITATIALTFEDRQWNMQ